MRTHASNHGCRTRLRGRSSVSRRRVVSSSRRTSSQLDCIAMLIPSATTGCASPAALPTRKMPSRRVPRIPGRIGPAERQLRSSRRASDSASRAPAQCRVMCLSTASPAGNPGASRRHRASQSRLMQHDRLTRPLSEWTMPPYPPGNVRSGINPGRSRVPTKRALNPNRSLGRAGRLVGCVRNPLWSHDPCAAMTTRARRVRVSPAVITHS